MGRKPSQPTLEIQEMAIWGFIGLAVGEAGGVAASGSGRAWTIHPGRGLGLVEIPRRRRRTVRWTGHRNLLSAEDFQVWLPHALWRRASPPEPGRALRNVNFGARCVGAARHPPPGASEFMGHAPLADVDLTAEMGKNVLCSTSRAQIADYDQRIANFNITGRVVFELCGVRRHLLPRTLGQGQKVLRHLEGNNFCFRGYQEGGNAIVSITTCVPMYIGAVWQP